MFQENQVVSFTYQESTESRLVKIEKIDYKNFQILGQDKARNDEYRRFKLHEIKNAVLIG